MGKKLFLKVLYTIHLPRCIWLLVGLVRLLKSLHKGAARRHLLCDDNSDLIGSKTVNQMPDIQIDVFLVYDNPPPTHTHTHTCSYCLILQFNCKIELGFYGKLLSIWYRIVTSLAARMCSGYTTPNGSFVHVNLTESK